MNELLLRDSKGHEVDLGLDHGPEIDMIEINSSRTLGNDLFKGLIYYGQLYSQTRSCSLAYGGDQARTQHGVQTIPWRTIAAMEFD